MDSTMASDGFPDDRVTCATCRHAVLDACRCRKLRTPIILSLPFRCLFYLPNFAEKDQRPGAERWPDLQKTIDEIRGLDAEHADAQKRR